MVCLSPSVTFLDGEDGIWLWITVDLLASEESDGLCLICGFGWFRLSLITFVHRPSDGEPKKRQVLAGIKALKVVKVQKNMRSEKTSNGKTVAQRRPQQQSITTTHNNHTVQKCTEYTIMANGNEVETATTTWT